MLLESILESVGDGIVAVDRQGNVLFANPAARKILGRAVEDAPIESWPRRYGLCLPDRTTAYPPESFPLVLALAGHPVENTEIFLSPKDDAEGVWLSWRAWPLAGGQGAVAAFRDSTAYRRAEDQAGKARTMEAIGNLAGGLAHDFNNLLMVIGGNAEFISEGLSPSDPQHTPIREITRAADRAAAVTGQLLSFSGRQLVRPRVLSLNSLITAVSGRLQQMLGERIEVSMALDSWLELVCVDPDQIEQAIWSLALNARDAMPGGGRLTIATANAEQDGAGWIVLSVSDTGSGMDENVKSHLFEPFFTTKGFGNGHGLALSAVYGIIKRAGGEICVASERGLGSTFEIRLPAMAASQAHDGIGRGSRDGEQTWELEACARRPQPRRPEEYL